MAIDPTLAELARKTNCDKQICRKCVLRRAAPSFRACARAVVAHGRARPTEP
jgi:ribosomal protein L40E